MIPPLPLLPRIALFRRLWLHSHDLAAGFNSPRPEPRQLLLLLTLLGGPAHAANVKITEPASYDSANCVTIYYSAGNALVRQLKIWPW
jgi:hypothetical protein